MPAELKATPPTPERADVQKSESEQPKDDVAKRLELTKQELEIEKLRKDLEAYWLEKFKAFAGVFTVIGIIGTLFLGVWQQRQAQIARDDERFDRAVTRLGSLQASERLTGLSSLQQFIQGATNERQSSALVYLVNATVIEQDATVRSAMVDVFEALPTLRLSSSTLNDGLYAARNRNRAIFNGLRETFNAKEMAAKKLLVDPSFDEVPLGNLVPQERASLEASAKLIAAIVRAGGRIEDLSNIYCPECIFSSVDSPAHLPNIKFDQAILRRAVFEGAYMPGSSFHNADLILSNFMGADLRSAKFTADIPTEPWNVQAAYSSGNLAAAVWGTNFSCSDLSNADFDGKLIFGLVYDNPMFGGVMHDEFQRANLSGANFERAQILLAIPESLVPPSPDGKTRNLPYQLEPFAFSQIAGPGDAALPFYDKGNFFVWTAVFAGPGYATRASTSGYTRDLSAALSSLFASRNVEEAKLPQELAKFAYNNPSVVRKPASTYDCQNR